MNRLALTLLMMFSISCAGSGPPAQQGPEPDLLDEIDPLPPAPPPVAVPEEPRAPRPETTQPVAGPAEEEVEEEAPQEIAPGPEMWEEYQNERRFDCVGPFDRLPAPYSFPLQGRTVTIEGYSMTVSPPDWGEEKKLKIGIMGATKDSYPETLGNLRRFIRWFEDKQVSVVVVNGDIGYEARDMVKSMELLARTRKLVLVMAGNADPVSGFNRVMKELSVKWPNLVNANFVRRVEVDGHTLISLPGYFDSEFVNAGSGCQYYRSDVKSLGRLLDEATGVPVFFSHGPPRGRGKKALDFAFDAGNVGDKRMGDFLKKRKVRFGVFGHILESGGRAVTATTRKPVKPETWSPNLYVNTGGASSLLADLHDGTSHRGMAGIIELEGDRARVIWDHLPAD